MMDSNWAITLRKQPITFVVRKEKVQLMTVARSFKKFRSDFKNLENQVKSNKPKTVDSILQATETNPAISKQILKQ